MINISSNRSSVLENITSEPDHIEYYYHVMAGILVTFIGTLGTVGNATVLYIFTRYVFAPLLTQIHLTFLRQSMKVSSCVRAFYVVELQQHGHLLCTRVMRYCLSVP